MQANVPRQLYLWLPATHHRFYLSFFGWVSSVSVVWATFADVTHRTVFSEQLHVERAGEEHRPEAQLHEAHFEHALGGISWRKGLEGVFVCAPIPSKLHRASAVQVHNFQEFWQDSWKALTSDSDCRGPGAGKCRGTCS